MDQLHALMIEREADLTFLIDMDPETGLSRAKGRGGPEERFEDFGLSLQQASRQGFLDLADEFPDRIVVIDGNRPQEAVAADIADHMDRRAGMSTDLDDIPEADRVEGAPHPRDTARLIGQSRAEAAFLEAYNTGRLHHGWLITGPRGVGKATLAWRIARFLTRHPACGRRRVVRRLAPARNMDIAPDHPVAPPDAGHGRTRSVRAAPRVG